MLYVQYIYIYIVYINLYRIYLFVSNAIKVYETHNHSFGTFDSNRIVVILLYKQALPVSDCRFNVMSTLHTFLNSISIISNCTYAIMSECNNTICVNNLFTLFRLVYYI